MEPAFKMLDNLLGPPEQWGIPLVAHATKGAAHLCGPEISVWAAESGRAYWRNEARKVAQKVADRVSGVAFDTHGNVGVVAPTIGAAKAAFAVMLAAESVYSGPYDQWPEEELKMLGVTDWPRHPRQMMELCPHQLCHLIPRTPNNKMGVCHSLSSGRVEITLHPTRDRFPVREEGEDFIIRYPSDWGLPCIMARKAERVEFAPTPKEEPPSFGVDF